MYNKEQVEEGLRNLFNEIFEAIPTKDNCDITFGDNNNAVIKVIAPKDYNKVIDFLDSLGNYHRKYTLDLGSFYYILVVVHVPCINWTKFEV